MAFLYNTAEASNERVAAATFLLPYIVVELNILFKKMYFHSLHWIKNVGPILLRLILFIICNNLSFYLWNPVNFASAAIITIFASKCSNNLTRRCELNELRRLEYKTANDTERSRISRTIFNTLKKVNKKAAAFCGKRLFFVADVIFVISWHSYMLFIIFYLNHLENVNNLW